MPVSPPQISSRFIVEGDRAAVCDIETDDGECNLGACPCEVSQWSEWAGCDCPVVTTQTRSRTVILEGPGCPSLDATSSCNCPPVHCAVSEWQRACTEERIRFVVQAPLLGGNACPALTETLSVPCVITEPPTCTTDVLILLDESDSLQFDAESVVSEAIMFASGSWPANGRVAVASFSDQPRLLVPFTDSQADVVTALRDWAPLGGNTSVRFPSHRFYALIVSVNKQPLPFST